jgi:hypothetical protein
MKISHVQFQLGYQATTCTCQICMACQLGTVRHRTKGAAVIDTRSEFLEQYVSFLAIAKLERSPRFYITRTAPRKSPGSTLRSLVDIVIATKRRGKRESSRTLCLHSSLQGCCSYEIPIPTCRHHSRRTMAVIQPHDKRDVGLGWKRKQPLLDWSNISKVP